MHILVTGGCGFIGSHLVDRLLADGHNVTVLDDLSSGNRTNLSAEAILVEGDVADAGLVARLAADADMIFHLAAVASVEAYHHDRARCHRTNFGGTQAVFEAAKARQVPVVYASSAAVYGDNQDLPLSETARAQPISDYGRDKLAGEVLAAAAWESHQIASTGLRFFNVYGPRQDARSPYSGVISKFMANLEAGLKLTFFGDGEQTRDFIYVGDVVSLLIKAQQGLAGAAVYNGCTGLTINLRNLAQAIGKSLNKEFSSQHEATRAGDIRHSRGNPDMAREKLGFSADITLSDGLASLVASHA